jgi:outer membrane murein-binding lipoprotein Lpp
MGHTLTLTTELLVTLGLAFVCVLILGYCLGAMRETRRNHKWIGATVIELEGRVKALNEDIDAHAEQIYADSQRLKAIEERLGLVHR